MRVDLSLMKQEEENKQDMRYNNREAEIQRICNCLSEPNVHLGIRFNIS